MASTDDDPPSAGNRKVAFDPPLLAFFLLAYAIAWSLWLAVAVVAREAGVGTNEFLAMIEAQDFEGRSPVLPGWLLYAVTRGIDFAFSISGVVVAAAISGIAGLRALLSRLLCWRFGLRLYALALLPVWLYSIAAVLAGGTLEMSVDTAHVALFSLNSGLLVSFFLRGAMGEELGLRGFALPRLQERLTPVRASLVIGVLWGLWHLPVLFSRGPVTALLFLVLAIALSFIFTLLFNGSGGSLIPVLLFHATQNWEEGFEAFFPNLVGTDWETPSALLLLLAGVAAGVVVWRQGDGQERAHP